jgi:hypothetical protein
MVMIRAIAIAGRSGKLIGSDGWEMYRQCEASCLVPAAWEERGDKTRCRQRQC